MTKQGIMLEHKTNTAVLNILLSGILPMEKYLSLICNL